MALSIGFATLATDICGETTREEQIKRASKFLLRIPRISLLHGFNFEHLCGRYDMTILCHFPFVLDIVK
ncbi:hypothetical protein KC19_VG237900 [Ceratodon purpureus]|uniref:Uncharacterized protein n=1 Tax=Ceratodon purpureus TaxID=3225 RepID=A0A8T0HTH4_CERPU|nr:hypothetical protein KC19_VG237900 [Ceratodon purpureus]